jgi:hypothetical protein
MDRPYDLVAVGVLGEIAARPGPQRREESVVVGVRGEHDDLGAGVVGADPTGRLDAVAAGHAQIHQHDVRGEFGDEPYGLLAVARRPDHL